MWIADEGKAVRKSLRTRDFEAAVARAETEVLEILSNLSTGKNSLVRRFRNLWAYS